VPASAEAGNGLHPRTKVVWNDTQCFDVVDRSVDPIYQVDYDIPFEDTAVTEDEVTNSRTHQFFAICRQFHSQIFVPNWVTWADVDSAVAKDLIDATGVEDDHVLETNPAWDGCWFRVNEDADRRPITDEMAAQPVPWDTTGVPVGTYVIWGYTYEPAFNLWTQREGSIVKVIDGGDPMDIGPGGAITTTEQTPYKGESVPIEGCVNALPGSTMTASFASTGGASSPDWEPEWTPFAEDVAVEGEAFTLDFLAPEEFAGETLMVRIDITDPMDRTYEAHMKQNVIVLKGMETDCETGGDFIGGAGCGESESDTSGMASGSESAEGTATEGAETSATTDAETDGSTAPIGEDDDDGEKSCNCTTSRGPTPLHLGALLVLFGIARRRRAA
jgi:MYXO-CTERM domain-containing protein